MRAAYNRGTGLSARQRLISGIDLGRIELTEVGVRRITGTIRVVNHLGKHVINLGAS